MHWISCYSRARNVKFTVHHAIIELKMCDWEMRDVRVGYMEFILGNGRPPRKPLNIQTLSTTKTTLLSPRVKLGSAVVVAHALENCTVEKPVYYLNNQCKFHESNKENYHEPVSCISSCLSHKIVVFTHTAGSISIRGDVHLQITISDIFMFTQNYINVTYTLYFLQHISSCVPIFYKQLSIQVIA